jgi:hypothetical protein
MKKKRRSIQIMKMISMTDAPIDMPRIIISATDFVGARYTLLVLQYGVRSE